MTLSQAGTFTGPDGISEYVHFSDASSPYIANYESLNHTVALTGFTGTECIFSNFLTSYYELAEEHAGPGVSLTVSVMMKLHYNPTLHKVTQMIVYYDAPFLKYFFEKLDTPATAQLICETMKTNQCKAVWEENVVQSTGNADDWCISEMNSRPLTTSTADLHDYIDSDSKSCRMLHAVMARNNGAHCPHISFLPITDICQKSNGLLPEHSFSKSDFASFGTYKVQHNIHPVNGYIEGRSL
eukprot:gene21572-25946_t